MHLDPIKLYIENTYPMYILPFMIEQAEEDHTRAEKDLERAGKAARGIIVSPGNPQSYEQQKEALKIGGSTKQCC